MMDKRAVLAVVISFVIIALYYYLFAPAPPPPKKAAPTQEEIASAPPPRPTQRETGPAEVSLKEIKIETEKMLIILSNRGGGPVSWKLKDYKDKPGDKGEPMELLGFNPDQVASLPLEVSFSTDGVPASAPQGSRYQTNGRSRILSGSSDRLRLDFRREYPAEGVRVVKSYQFSNDGYKVPLTITLTNITDRRWVQRPVLTLARPFPAEGKVKDIGYVAHSDGNIVREGLKRGKKENLDSETLRWFGIDEKYFLAAILPKESGPYRVAVERGDGLITARLIGPPVTLRPGESKRLDFTLFMGPKEIKTLKSMGADLDQAINFGWFSVIAKPLLYILQFFHRGVGNYGLAIILLTMGMRVVFWPLNQKSFRSMSRMQKLQPLIAKLRERYKSDKVRMNKEVMNLYRQYKVSPLGGCLPIMVQMPILYALYSTLMSAIEMRHAHFIFWINDLSAKDPTYITPILMGGTMFLQQRLTPTMGDPAQAKMMMFMPVIFTVMFLSFPSGLVLYWLVTNVLSVAQQHYTYRMMAVAK